MAATRGVALEPKCSFVPTNTRRERQEANGLSFTGEGIGSSYKGWLLLYELTTVAGGESQ